jgi:hypothetical protein
MKATTESAAIPPYGVLVQVLETSPASATVSMSRPVERNAMSAGWPATIARACEPDGPYDCENETPWRPGLLGLTGLCGACAAEDDGEDQGEEQELPHLGEILSGDYLPSY